MVLRTIVIDDEDLARERLIGLLKKYELIEVIQTARDGLDAIQTINEHTPDLIFLDIDMPGCDGFSVLKNIKQMPLVIFVTAFDQYALQAFETNSVDYILKPAKEDRLDKAIEKLKNLTKFGTDKTDDIKAIDDEKSKLLNFVDYHFNTLPVKTDDGYILLKTSEVLYIKAEDKYARIFDDQKRDFLVDYSLVQLEQKYEHAFIRIHRNIIVNQHKIKGLRKWFKGKFKVVMQDNSTHEISKRRLDVVKKLLLM